MLRSVDKYDKHNFNTDTRFRHVKLPPIGGFQTFLFGSGSLL